MATESLSPAPLQILEDIGLTNLPEDWGIVRVEELLSEDRGISVGVMYPGHHDPLGVPLIKAGDLAGSRINPRPEFRITQEKHHEYRRTTLTGNELLISLVGDVGRCAIVPHEMRGWNAARAIAVLRFARPMDAPFVRLCLLSQPLQYLMQAWATTTVQATLNLKEIRQIPLPWPPKNQRDAVANIVDALDDKIELNRRMNETLEAMARAIFKSWFVDFDPVRAKVEGRQPFGMAAATAALFPNSFQDSPLGKIPKGWKAGTLGEIAENPRRGIDPSKVSPGTPYIGLEHIPKKSIALPNWGHADQVASNKSVFKQGEILFGKLRPYFHKVGVAVQDGVCSTDILAIRERSKEWYGLMLGHVSSEDFINYADAVSTGTKMPRTNWLDMTRYELAIPDPRAADAYNQFTLKVVAMVRQNILQSRTLTAIRDALLPKLISGEIRVKDAGKLMEKTV